MIKTPDKIVQAGKNMIAALTQSGAAYADGAGEISRHVIQVAHKSVEAHMATGKEMLDIRTPNEWMEFQTKWAGDFITTTVGHMTQMYGLVTKVANQTCEPLKAPFVSLIGKNGVSI